MDTALPQRPQAPAEGPGLNGAPRKPGVTAYALAAIILGLIGLAWRDFATEWQHVGEGVPHRRILAVLAAIYEIGAGLAVLSRKRARGGALALSILYLVFALLWVPEVARAPQTYDNWGNLFEELSLGIGGAVAFFGLAPGQAAPRRAAAVGRLYGICALSFGLDHFIYLHRAASFVPRWIPPGQVFWVAATAVCFLLAAFAILSGIRAGLASRLLLTMIAGFEVLIWIPRLAAGPHQHFLWSANGISLAMAAAAWVVSDALSGRGQGQPARLL